MREKKGAMALINTSIALPIDFRLNFEVIENDKTLINDNFNTQIQQSFVSIRFDSYSFSISIAATICGWP